MSNGFGTKSTKRSKDIHSKERREKLIAYGLELEKLTLIINNTPDADLFYRLVGRMASFKYITSSSANRVSTVLDPIEDCLTYNCVLSYSTIEQKEMLKRLKRKIVYSEANDKEVAILKLKGIASDARKKIRACYPEKDVAIVTDPESRILVDERILLEYMCKERLLED